jgi:hypothetical protein
MRLRDRKKAIDRQSLFNIHLARFTAELNQTIEEAYRSLGEVLDLAGSDNDDEVPGDSSLEDITDRPPKNL